MLSCGANRRLIGASVIADRRHAHSGGGGGGSCIFGVFRHAMGRPTLIGRRTGRWCWVRRLARTLKGKRFRLGARLAAVARPHLARVLGPANWRSTGAEPREEASPEGQQCRSFVWAAGCLTAVGRGQEVIVDNLGGKLLAWIVARCSRLARAAHSSATGHQPGEKVGCSCARWSSRADRPRHLGAGLESLAVAGMSRRRASPPRRHAAAGAPR